MVAYYNSSNKGEKVLQNLHYKNNNEKDNGKRLNLEDRKQKILVMANSKNDIT
jgi:hypothetical protein